MRIPIDNPTSIEQPAAGRSANAIRIHGVDLEVWRSADVREEVSENGLRRQIGGVVVPGSIPDYVDAGSAGHDWSSVVSNRRVGLHLGARFFGYGRGLGQLGQCRCSTDTRLDRVCGVDQLRGL